MTARLAAMWRDCGDYDRAQQLLAQAHAQASALEPDDDTHRILAATAETPFNRDHRCGVEMASTPGPQDFIARPRADVSVPEVTEWPEDEILDGPPAPPGTQPPPVPPRPMPTPVLPQPVVARPIVTQPIVTQPLVSQPLVSPMSPHPLAPAPPERPKRSGVLPVIVLGILAATAVALVAFAIVAAGRDSDIAGPPNDPPTSAPPANVAPAFGPVTDIHLADNGTSIVVTWDYPDTANAPIIVSAALAGEPMRPMQSLPAGTETYTLPGLNPQRDYCLTVTIAYSAENTVMAPPTCTTRKSG